MGFKIIFKNPPHTFQNPLLHTGLSIDEINTQLHLHPQCSLTTRQDIIDYLQPFIHTLLTDLVESNLPYSSWRDDRPIPSRPLKQACRLANESIARGDVGLGPVYALLNASYNTSGEFTHGFCIRSGQPDCVCTSASKCFEKENRARQLQSLAQLYQQCTQLVYSRCSQGPPNDLFWPPAGNATNCISANSFIDGYQRERCQAQLSAMISDYNASDPRWDPDYVTQHFFKSEGNAIGVGAYVSGEYAPWSAGNIEEANPSEEIFTFPGLEEAAPGLELRQPRLCDSPRVLDLRFRLVQIMQCWRNGSTTGDCDRQLLANRTVHLIGGKGESGVVMDCRVLVHAYPWNRTFEDAAVAGSGSGGVQRGAHFWIMACVGVVLSLLVHYFYSVGLE